MTEPKKLTLEEFVKLLPNAPQPLAQHHIELLRLCERIGPKRLVINLPRGGRRC